MKPRFRVNQRGDREGMCYCKDTLTGERESLETKDRDEAERIVFHKNEALKTTAVNHRIGMNYLSASDPQYASRTWQFVIDDIVKDKTGSTLERYERALKDPAYDLIRDKLLVETSPHDLRAVLRAGGTATNVYLRRLQNHAFEMDWLPKRIISKKLFPKIKHKEARAITGDEHRLIIGRERNPERRDFYELLWHTGGSQSDVAMLENDDIDREKKCFSYERCKNSHLAGMKLGPQGWAVIERRPQ